MSEATEQVSHLDIADRPEEELPADAEIGSAAASDAAATSSLPKADNMDSIVEYCLIEGLKAVEDGDLPMLTSDFYSKHMLPCKPPDITLDLKKSSYKKLSKLLTKFEKKGLLTQKLVHKQDNLASINRGHALLAGASTAKSQSTAGARQDAKPTAPATSKAAPAAKIDIQNLYRVPTSLSAVFTSLATAGTRDQLFSEAEVRQALHDYTAKEGLQTTDGALRIDKLLAGSLFGKKELEQAATASHAFDDLYVRLLSKLQSYHKVVRTGEEGSMEAVNKGQIKNIMIQLEDRQGGRKHLTRIVHVESFAIDPEAFAKQLQRRLTTNATVEKLPGKQEVGKQIALQGSLVQDVMDCLQQVYGISPQYVDIKGRN